MEKNPDKSLQERESVKRKRIFIIVIVGIVCFLIFLAVVLTALLVLREQEWREQDEAQRHRIAVVTQWTTVFQNVMTESFTTAFYLEGYVYGNFSILPPVNGTIAERVAGQEFTAFPEIAANVIMNTETSVAMQLLIPGGVISQTYPNDPSMLLTDTFNTTESININSPTPKETVELGTPVIVGPRRSPAFNMRNGWALNIRVPVYNITNQADHSWDNFWGFTSVIVNITGVLERKELRAEMERQHLDYALFSRFTNGTAYVVESNVFPDDDGSVMAVTRQLEQFIADNTGGSPFLSGNPMSLVVRSRETANQLNSMSATLVVLCTLFGVLALFVLAVVAVFACVRDYRGGRHAPKMPPLAVVCVGPSNPETLWSEAPEAMARVHERLEEEIQRAMRVHHAYEVPQGSKGSASVFVLRSVADGVAMCFDLLERLERRPVDGPTRRRLGHRGMLLVTCSVHWCADVLILADARQEDVYQYIGPGMATSANLWSYSAPNTVVLSGAAKEVAEARLPYCTISYLSSVVVSEARGGSGASTGSDDDVLDIYTITHPGNPHLRRAEQRAAEQIRLAAAGQEDVVINGLYVTPEAQQLFVPVADEARWRDGADAAPDPDAPAEMNGHDTALVYAFPRRVHGAANANNSSANAGDSVGGLVHVLPITHAGAGAGPGASGALSSSHVGASRSYAPGRSARAGPRSVSGAGASRIPLERNNVTRIIAGSSSGSSHHAGRGGGRGRRDRDDGGGGDNSSAGGGGSATDEGDGLTRLLLHPTIPPVLEDQLGAAYEHQAVAVSLRYAPVRVLVYYFYVGYKTLFKPLAGPERENIYRRLIQVFGIPHRCFLEHLAARCAIVFLQQNEEARSLLWDQELRHRHDTPSEAASELHARSSAHDAAPPSAQHRSLTSPPSQPLAQQEEI